MVQLTVLLSLLLALLLGASEAHIPRPCATAEALQQRRCCPDWQGSPCGSAYNRGECVSFETPFRIWPPPVYELFCKCNGNFDTYDCSRCKPGYKGENCTERQTYVRKEVSSLPVEERKRLSATLHKAKHVNSERYVITTREFNDTDLKFENASVYDLFVWMHYYAGVAAAEGGQRNAAHQGPSFPFWHRYFLLFMEREIRDLTGDDSFYIPYWDWTKTDNCNICTNELLGESTEDGYISENSTFSSWETVCTYDDDIGLHGVYRKICVKPPSDQKPKPIRRAPGTDSKSDKLPSLSDVQYTLATEEYDTHPYDRNASNSFRNRLEGFDKALIKGNLTTSMHNLVHNYLNGTVSHVPIAANDPIFMLHHAMIDKIFEDWLKDHRNMKYPISDAIPPIQRANNNMRPFVPPVRNDYLVGVTAEDLGYRYE